MATNLGIPTELLNAALLEQVVRIVDRISKSVEKLTDSVETAGTKAERTVKESVEQNETLDRILGEINKKFATYREEQEKQEGLWKRLKTAKDKYFEEHPNQAKFAGGAMGAGSALMGGNVLGAAQSAVQGLPFGIGGFLGFMMWGKYREAEFTAAAQRSIALLRQGGTDARGQLGAITGEIRSMYAAFGSMGEELDATLGALTEIGQSEHVFDPVFFDKSGKAVKGFANEVGGVATRMDLLLKSQPGTTAKLIGETMMASGASATVATNQVLKLGFALRDLKLNYAQFGAGILQATSALRTQNQSLEDTQKVFDRLRRGFEASGVDRQRAGQLALQGVQAAGGALGGMPEGLQGMVAQRLAQGGQAGFAGMTDPVALLTKFRLGQEGGKDTGFMSASFQTLADIIKEAVPDKAGLSHQENELNRVYALSKVGGMSEEAARAILRQDKNSLALLSPAEQTAKFSRELATAFKKRGDEQNSFERELRVITMALMDVGSNILSILVDIFRLGQSYFLHPLAGKAYRERLDEDVNKRIHSIGESFKKAGTALGSALNFDTVPENMSAEALKAEREAQERAEDAAIAGGAIPESKAHRNRRHNAARTAVEAANAPPEPFMPADADPALQLILQGTQNIAKGVSVMGQSREPRLIDYVGPTVPTGKHPARRRRR